MRLGAHRRSRQGMGRMIGKNSANSHETARKEPNEHSCGIDGKARQKSLCAAKQGM